MDFNLTLMSALLAFIQLEVETLVIDFWRKVPEPYRSIIATFSAFEVAMLIWTQLGTPPLWVDVAFGLHTATVLAILAYAATGVGYRRLIRGRRTSKASK